MFALGGNIMNDYNEILLSMVNKETIYLIITILEDYLSSLE